MSNGIENFFKTQVTVFDQAVQFEKSLHDDLDRIAENEEAHKALNTIRLITMVQTGSKFNYNRIRELNPLMDTVRTAHGKMLEEKRCRGSGNGSSVYGSNPHCRKRRFQGIPSD